MEGGEQAGLAVDRRARHVRALERELHGRDAAARGEPRVEPHLAAARRGPFVVAGRRVRAERERRDGLVGVRAEQLRAGGRGRDRARDARGPEDLRDVGVHDHPADLAAHLVARDERRQEFLAARARAFREREQRRHEHGAEMAHAADVHVVAHETVAGHAVREGRVLHGHDVARADDAGAAPRERRPSCGARPRRPARLHGSEVDASAEESRSSTQSLAFAMTSGERSRHEHATERVRHPDAERLALLHDSRARDGHRLGSGQPRISTPAHSS